MLFVIQKPPLDVKKNNKVAWGIKKVITINNHRSAYTCIHRGAIYISGK
jgi:hypothetical protein